MNMYEWLNCSETNKLSNQMGKYPSFFNQLGIGFFNGVSIFDNRGIFSNWVFCNLICNNFLCLSPSIFVLLNSRCVYTGYTF